MKKIAIIIIILSIIFLVIVTFLQMGKPIQELFSRTDKIIENQHLTEDTFTLLNLSTYKTKVLDLNKNLILSFRSPYNINKFKDENRIKELSEQQKGLFIIINDTIELSKTLRNTVPMYYIDTINMPLKQKKLLYPYTIIIDKKKITKIILGDLEKMINDESNKN